MTEIETSSHRLVLSVADRGSVLWCLRSSAGGFFLAGTIAAFGLSAAAFVLLLFSLFFLVAGATVLFRAVTTDNKKSTG
jgi:hypothetical protein